MVVMSKTLVIVGAGREQIAAYIRAKDMNLTVVGTDIQPDAPALKYADHAIIASTRDVDSTERALLKYAANHSVDGVMTIANDVPYTVAKIARTLGLPGVAPDSVVSLTNKLTMKSCFVENGVNTPSFREVVDARDLEGSQYPYPFIVKPVDGRGSRGVLLVDSDTDLTWAYSHAVAHSDIGKVIMEEFVPGPQLSVEGIFVDGEYKAVAYADRNYGNLKHTKPFIVEDGGAIPSRFDGPILEEVRALIERGARSLGIDWGPVKADIVLLDGHTPCIIELAGRLSGNYLATHHIPFSYGIDLVGVMIDLSTGAEIAIDRLQPTSHKFLGVRYFFPPPGRITAINGIDELRKNTLIHSYMIYSNVGDIQQEIDNHGARAGTVMVRGDNYDDAIKNAVAAIESVEFVVEPV